MSRKNVEDIYPLSPVQHGMLFHALDTSQPGVYMGQLGWTLRGTLDLSAFQRAWQEVVERHPILRTAFVWERLEDPMQIVKKGVVLPVDQHDLRSLAEPEQAAFIERFLREDSRRGFDLTRAPLMRLTLLRLRDDSYRFIWSRHHLLLDGWSTPILLKEVFALYEGFAHGKEVKLDKPRPYGEYIAWLKSQDLDKAKAFWKQELAGFHAPTPLTVDHPPTPGVLDRVFDERTLDLPEATADALQAFCRKHQLTMGTVLQAAWALVLSRYSGETDIVFGATASGRSANVPGIERMVGLFINTLTVRIKVEPDMPLVAWLSGINRHLAELREYEHTPLVEVQEQSEIPRGTRLFESLLVYENYPFDESLRQGLKGLSVGQASATTRTNFPVMVVGAVHKTLHLLISYHRRRVDAAAVDRMLGHIATLLEGMLLGADRPVSALSLLTAAERKTLLFDWNQTAAAGREGACIHTLFEAQVEKNPEAIALVFEDQHLSYRALNHRANQLAHYLRKFGVGPEVLVGISMRRSPALYVAILGVLKAGGAYVPLDPTYPEERLSYMMDDSGVTLLLSEDDVLDNLPAVSVPVIALDSGAAVIDKESSETPAPLSQVSNVAYVIYTSGSTGRPKGVMVEHRGFASLAIAHAGYFGVGPGKRVLAFSSINFDASVWEMVMALLNGATLVVARQEALLPGPDLVETLRRHAVNVATIPPSILAATPEASLPDLKCLIVAGEACSEELVSRWAEGRAFWNAYGPTEASICTTIVRCTPGVKPTIGRPIPNVQVYILDGRQAPVPIGVPGELCAGGVGVARGYLNRPELTEEKFIPSPFREGERLYRTGDLCRYRGDGEIEYLGRIDQQVKVRGYRIELGEIEARLMELPGVQEAVVIAREDRPGENRLVAYIIPIEPPLPEVGVLRAFLGERLPEYMIPSAFVELLDMPRTPSGKVDRKALPAPEGRAVREAVAGPRNPVEEVVAGIWAELFEVERVSIHDDFFELGGHSLLATQVMARIALAFQIELPIQHLFELPTVAKLSALLEGSIRSKHGIEAPPLVHEEHGGGAGEQALSFAQERLWFLEQLEPGASAYVLSTALRLEGRLDVACLEQAINDVIQRHEVLRTTFVARDGKPALVVHPALRAPLPIIDFSTLPEVARAEPLRRELSAESQRPFDLGRGPLVRAQLFRMAEEDHVLAISMHHIVSDAWSMGVFAREVSALYEAHSHGHASPLEDLSIQYADYARWQQAWMRGGVLERQLSYWKQQLEGAPQALDLPADRPRPPVQSYAGAKRSFTLAPELARALQETSRREGATLYMTLLAAFAALLHRYSGQRDLLIGSPIANRSRAETEGLIGFFLNTLVLRVKVGEEASFRDLLKSVRTTCLEAYAHQDMPFERLVAELLPVRDQSRSPLFQVMFTLQNTPDSGVSLEGLTIEGLTIETATAKFDLTLTLIEGQKGLSGAILYNTDLFDAATIDRLIEHFSTLLQGAVKEPQRLVGDLPILPEAEKRKLLVEWNDTAAEYPYERCLHQLFEEKAAERPDADAVIFEGETLTYRELDERSNRLARRLKALGVGAESLVGIAVERSAAMVVGLLGILKAGGAYVPLDPTYPRDRLAFMLADAQIRVLLTEEKVAADLPPHGAEMLRLDADWAAVAAESSAAIDGGAGPESLAYVIYTSGSTGKPKGVQIPHRAVVNFLSSMQRSPGISASDRLLAVTSLSFDIAGLELFLPLLSGATVVVASRAAAADGRALRDLIAQRAITVMQGTPSTFRLLLEAGWEGDGKLKALVGGEAVPRDLVDRLGERCGPVWNMYGPTETTIWSAIHPLAKDAPILIGRPIANTALLVLGPRLALCPIGVPGELHIGGEGLARGYLHQPELSAARFIPDPLRKGETLYKTGDLVRVREGGALEFLGRLDHQVKLRGYRIELGEIEAALGEHPAVAEVVAQLREDVPGDKRLVAYLVARGKAPAAAELRAWLKGKLPDYMIPSAFAALDRLPLTPNGKVDRKALPAPEVSADPAARVAPRGPVEESVAAIFGEVLRVPAERIGAHDGFFDLGGHSLLATQAVARIRGTFGVELPLRRMFEAPSVAELGAEIEALLKHAPGPARPPLTRAPGDAARPLSFAQERLWFLDRLEPNDPTYVISVAVRFHGALDVAILAASLGEVIRRHEVLRTSFAPGEAARLVVEEPRPVEIPVMRWHALPRDEREVMARREASLAVRQPFDLTTAPLLRARLFEIDPDEHLLLLMLHHIAADGWTMNLLTGEIASLYQAFLRGEPSPLPELPVQYADYARWQRAWLSGPVLDAQLAYWREKLAGAPASLNLPADRPRPPVPSHRGGRRSFALSPGLSQALKHLSTQKGVTLFMTLLAAFDVLLHRITGQSDVVIGSPIAGRAQAETEKLIGYFANTLVLRNNVDDGDTFEELLHRVKETCLGAYAHQDAPFERLVQELAPGRDLSRTPLFQVVFTLQNAPRERIELPGLTLSLQSAESGTAKFDLTLGMTEGEHGLLGWFEYSADLFDDATIERMVSHFEVLLQGIADAPKSHVGRLPLLPPGEKAQIAALSRRSGSFPVEHLIHEIFEREVDLAPDAIALRFEESTLSYAELDQRANRLAHHLRSLGVGPDVLVGLCVQRSLDLVVAILGILKAGGAYLPLDPDYPRDRLAFMIEDAKVPVLVTEEQHAAAIPSGGARVVRLDADWEALSREPGTRLPRLGSPESLAYVIYTSGSTGKPKGALVRHRNVVRLFSATRHWFGFGDADVWTLFHSYAFDFSVWEIWGALFHGGCLVVVPYWISRSPEAFYKLLCDEGVTVLNQTPSAFRQLVHAEPSAASGLTTSLRLRTVIFGGEALDLNDLRPFWDRHGDEVPRLVNMYGITETTVHVTYRALSRADLGRPWSSVIGRAIPDLSVHVLDRHLAPLPLGVPGEMYVGGAGVARGYLERPELSAERFIADPFSSDPAARLYKTGDLGRYLPTGDLEYLGRIDQQVKIRGFRIELGEIEAVLGQHPSVREALVMVRADGSNGTGGAEDKRLVAYLVAVEGPKPTVAELRTFLKEKLPEYMVPAAFVLLEAFPLTENGKVARNLLPTPEEAARPDLDSAFVAPRSGAEETLAKIWAAVLRLPRVGIHDNFFEIGGDSILSIQIATRAQQAGLRITPRQLFQHQTVAELCEVAGSIEAVVAEQGPIVGPVPLSPIQRWWIEQKLDGASHWNQSLLLELRDPADAAALEAAMAHLLEHHDALRLRLVDGPDGTSQIFAPPGGPSVFSRVDLSAVPAAERTAELERRTAELQGSLDLYAGPVARLVLFSLGPGERERMLFLVHHLSVDGVSWRILLEDLGNAYEQRRRGEDIVLPRKTSSFRRWTEKLVAHARSDALAREEAHWISDAFEPGPPLPADGDGDATEATAHTVIVTFGEEETEQLLRKVNDAYRTQINDVLLTAFAQTICAFTGGDAVVVDLEGHGREELFDDVDLGRTVGWFTALFPVALRPGTGGLGDQLMAIKEQLRAVPNKGIGYGMLRYLRDDDIADKLRSRPAPAVSFNYFGQFDQAINESAPFRGARESTGANKSPRAARAHLLDVNAGVAMGKLVVRWSHSRGRHRDETIEALAARFMEALRALIAHCLSAEARGNTPSDFKKVELSQKELSDMLLILDAEEPTK
ncbi:MAG: amino acid adenylation domain-containing protein [Byssovorax sp.]